MHFKSGGHKGKYFCNYDLHTHHEHVDLLI
ncbi:hypothetical protein SRABI133_01776 [Peribacillus simplex]|uniref:Uncharacterized protein n=1 Tax=Peribacillus simplex TaxID=1478 RepID=A0A9W4KRR7_9BACI|nr:hypothetical protein SRABI133_01776 [Peribacillus simplex]